MKLNEKVYLGDGVYSVFDGYHVVLTTENGISVSNTIFMEPRVMESLINYWKRLNANIQPMPSDETNFGG